MKWRENLPMKALAFIAAVAAFTATAIMGWYQLANFDALWSDGFEGGGYTRSYLVQRDFYMVRELVDLRDREAAGEELDLAEKRSIEWYEARLNAGATNLRWQLLDQNGRVLYGNTREDSAQVDVLYWTDMRRAALPETWADIIISEPSPSAGQEAAPYEAEDAAAEAADGEGETVSLVLWVDGALRVDDQYKRAADKLAHWQADREWFLGGTLALGTLGILLAAGLCCGAGHKRGAEGIYLNWFHRIPGDVLLCVLFLGGVLSVFLGVGMLRSFYGGAPMYFQLIALGLAVAAAAALGLGALVTVCARAKAHTLLRNTWTWRLCAWGWGAAKRCAGAARSAAAAVPLIWKAVLGCMAYTLFTIVTVDNGNASGLWLLATAVAAVYLCLWAYQWKRIRQGTQEIIGGNPHYHIDTRRMLPDLRGHADELNNLSQAIATAVDERLRSEHFKAELITNVSHDLKTPLTSIINYVDLLKKADIQDPKAAEYIEVLDRKSQRLKKLTEDLVEASKASTGNLTVNWERLDLCQLTDQALAECGERLEAQGLTVVRALPEAPMWVDADGRHLWRVLDNLLSNCAKYALPGTRVYVDLRESAGWAVLSVKNISRDALDIPAERLMERFVRGDESRNQAGSGLGLSIAQSLTELQHGRFAISIDGDLFKATVSLPLVGAEPEGLIGLVL